MFPCYYPIWAAACIGYGWMLQQNVNIARPLIISFIIDAGMQYNSQICQLLLVDMFPNNAFRWKMKGKPALKAELCSPGPATALAADGWKIESKNGMC
jgi:hypothetical protein